MYVIAVDDESLILKSMEKTLANVFADAQVKGFSTFQEAKSFIRKVSADNASACPDSPGFRDSPASIAYAFLDLRMRGENGLQMAKAIKDISPQTRIIFSTAYAGYTFDLRGDASVGYVMKPVTEEDVRDCVTVLDHAMRQYPSYKYDRPTDAANSGRRQLMIRTFGTFEAYSQGEPLVWDSQEAKVLLAILINAYGRPLTDDQIADMMWTDGNGRPRNDFLLSIHIRNLVKSLRKTLRTVHPNAGDLICRSRNATNIVKKPIDGFITHCDLCDMLRGSAYAANTYYGEYLPDYPWARFPTERLDPDR